MPIGDCLIDPRIAEPDGPLDVYCGNCGRGGIAFKAGSFLALPRMWDTGSVDGSLPVDLCEECRSYEFGPTVKVKLNWPIGMERHVDR
jgi:hypothetical protein